MLVLTSLSFLFVQGRHVKTGQLAAIKVMDVTEVRLDHVYLWKDRDFKVTPALVKSFLCLKIVIPWAHGSAVVFGAQGPVAGQLTYFELLQMVPR